MTNLEDYSRDAHQYSSKHRVEKYVIRKREKKVERIRFTLMGMNIICYEKLDHFF